MNYIGRSPYIKEKSPIKITPEYDSFTQKIKERKKLHKRRKQYRQYLKTKHWKNKRNKMLRISGHRCADCGNTKNLQVHHLTYSNLYKEPDKDLVVLCGECHLKRHNKG